ncbi:MAG TPA: hypothetical protein ENN81_10745 [Phycisphaerales bacterium]|nr:hypothetical protein [Phycisphaerales bacterium]
MQDRLVTIAQYGSYIEAELARADLLGAGIEAMVSGQNARNVLAGVDVIEEIELQVMEPDADRAVEVLQNRTEKE